MPARDDRGSGSVLVVALVAVALVLAGALGLLAQAAVAAARAGSAADLAALAAADAVLGRAAGDPCARAQRTAAADGARVVACEIAGTSVVVRVEVVPAGGAGRLGTAAASARAGAAS